MGFAFETGHAVDQVMDRCALPPAPAPAPAPGTDPLPDPLGSDLAEHFGADFDSVRVAPAASAASLDSMGVGAVTLGEDIAFGSSAYEPESPSGRRLIAHELAHILQQRGGTGGAPLADPAALESQAEEAATAAVEKRPVPGLSPAPRSAQARVSMRDVGRGEFSGFARVGELVARLNRVTVGLVFSLRHEGRYDWLVYDRILPVGMLSDFDRQMMGFIDDGADLLMRFTNRHGLLADDAGDYFSPDGAGGRVPNFVDEDAWKSGYVDIDDLLASSDLGFQAVLVHFLRERQVTRNYARRIGIPNAQPGALETRPGFQAEFDRAHRSGINAELELLRDYFGDPGIRVVNLLARRFRTTRGDLLRVVATPGRTSATSGVLAISWEVVLHDTHAVVSAEEYRDLLDRERAAAAAPLGP